MIEKNDIKNDILEPATHTDNQNDFLAILPLKNVVILPKSIVPVIVGRASSIAAVEYALKQDKSIFVTAQKHPDTEVPGSDDIFHVGIRANILQVMRMPNNALKILIEGVSRAQIDIFENKSDFSIAYATDIPSINTDETVELLALWRHLQELYLEYSKHNERAPSDLLESDAEMEDIDTLVDTVAVQLSLSFDERQEVLETPDLMIRMTTVATMLQKEIDILQTESRIKGRIQSQVEKNQREYYLAEQMKAIHKELGREDHSAELDELRAKAQKVGLSEDGLEKVEKEIRRLEQMPPLSSEAVVSRNYVDWMLSIPWKKQSKDTVSLTKAEKLLNKTHAGLNKAKERIIEFLAATKFSGSQEKAPIICLVGPPGVGKTSLASSIAKSLSREFVRISLGGIRDEAEIRGHRRTYIGALPGKIIQAMKKASTVNPVILLDEIDKMSQDMHGDPSSALLEVLDPEQNKNFTDHFLDTEYDLSKVMFITTANMLDTIPYPLYDRMEIISLSGYTDGEKISIAKKFLIPKKLKEYGLTTRQFSIPETSLVKIVSEYTKEAGVRQLERVIAKLMRKTIQGLLKGEVKRVTVDADAIKKWLGHPKFKKTSLDNSKDTIGLATGLAWTEVGGDVLEIEASVVAGKGTTTLTGQLGEVMQESAQAAHSYIRSRAKQLHIPNATFNNKDIHIHLPEGAVPKDGPSAGITMCLTMISSLTDNPIKPNIAMTGEITLRGRVLGVGGLKEKLLAAKQYGKTTVIVPKENYDDIQEFIKDLGDDLNLLYVSHVDEVLTTALVNDPFKKKKKTATKKRSTLASTKKTTRKTTR